jgi:putative endonuclease
MEIMVSGNNQKLGKWGEQLAIRWLSDHGLKLLQQGVRTPHGEIDIIMSEDDQIVFVEVKTRRNENFGYPESALTKMKFQHITSSAEYFFQQNPELDDNWRIDVVAIIGSQTMKYPNIQWFKNVHP